MSVAPKAKAIRNLVLSLAFLLLLLAVSLVVQDQSTVGVAIAFAVILGLPSLLLSVADLGRALKIEHAGNYRATAFTRLLSHYRAAGGAICIAVAGYTLFRYLPALINGTSAEPVTLQFARVVGGGLLAFLGFMIIVKAFAKESDESSDT